MRSLTRYVSSSNPSIFLLKRSSAVRRPLLLCLHEELHCSPFRATNEAGSILQFREALCLVRLPHSYLSITIPSFLSLTVMLSQYYNLYAPYMLYCPLCHDVRGLHKSLISFMLLTRFTLFTVLSCCVVIAHVTYIYQSIISFIITLI